MRKLLLETSRRTLNKGDTVSFDWKQGGTLIPVEGTVVKVLRNLKATGPAEKYLYTIKLRNSILIPMKIGQTVTAKRTSMKNVVKEAVEKALKEGRKCR